MWTEWMKHLTLITASALSQCGNVRLMTIYLTSNLVPREWRNVNVNTIPSQRARDRVQQQQQTSSWLLYTWGKRRFCYGWLEIRSNCSFNRTHALFFSFWFFYQIYCNLNSPGYTGVSKRGRTGNQKNRCGNLYCSNVWRKRQRKHESEIRVKHISL